MDVGAYLLASLDLALPAAAVAHAVVGAGLGAAGAVLEVTATTAPMRRAQVRPAHGTL